MKQHMKLTPKEVFWLTVDTLLIAAAAYGLMWFSGLMNFVTMK